MAKENIITKRKAADRDAVDNEVLNIIQTEFPVDPRPYKVLGEKVGLTEAEMIERVRALKQEKKIIRRIGASFERRKLGYVSSLVAAKVKEEGLNDFVKMVNGYSGVTHNYERDHAYNVWFTYIAETPEKLAADLRKIGEHPACEDLQNL
ncbi:MAG: Lrp/AsnC family transcriptional regulator, partial [Candidatus Methylomirabilis sp.]|nr:Lrp/AsnC family transcriptional regulator [Deltaproteobacteria bacterium]